MTEAAIISALRAKFSPPSWAFITNVANGTGANANRFADALAMGIWPSRGLDLYGFEVKASRSDWLRELAKPEKAESIFGYCDHWFIVAGSAEIVKADELPRTWGLMVLNGTGLKIVNPAPELQPKPVSRHFLAAMLRRSTEQTVDKEALRSEWQRGVDEGERRHKNDGKWLKDELDRIKKVCAEFENASGIKLGEHTWNAGRIGEAVKAYLEGTRPIEELSRVYDQLGKVLGRQKA